MINMFFDLYFVVCMTEALVTKEELARKTVDPEDKYSVVQVIYPCYTDDCHFQSCPEI
jgi:hypothetical protein